MPEPHAPTFLAFAGLPGTGKSTLAAALAARLGWPVLDKDVVRARLFGDAVDYSREQDDRAMAALYDEAAALLAGDAAGVLIDGRTFTRRAAVDALVAAAARAGARLLVVECRCTAALAEARLARDASTGAHPARNRDPELHRRLRAVAEPLHLTAPARVLVVSTESGDLSRPVDEVLALLRGPLR